MKKRPSAWRAPSNAGPKRPSAEELESAYGKTISDVIGSDLDVLFVGINPSLYSAAVGYHFARPGNRFWPALHQSGFTPHKLVPAQQNKLLPWGLGVTNLVARATARADQLDPDEYLRGARSLQRKVARYRPRYVAIVGVTAYRSAYHRPRANVGFQPEHTIETARVWVLPNPSGLNAHYQLDDLTREFRKLRKAV